MLSIYSDRGGLSWLSVAILNLIALFQVHMVRICQSNKKCNDALMMKDSS